LDCQWVGHIGILHNLCSRSWGRSRLGPDLVMATALPWLGNQHTLTRMLQSWQEEAGIVVVVLSGDMKVDWPHGLMMFGGVMLGKVIGQLVSPGHQKM